MATSSRSVATMPGSLSRPTLAKVCSMVFPMMPTPAGTKQPSLAKYAACTASEAAVLSL